MKNKVISTALIVAMVGVMIAGCSTAPKQTVKTDYVEDLSEYITLGEYKGLTYQGESTEVTDEEIEQEIEALLDSGAEDEKITEGTVAAGDTVNIDYVGYIDGTAFDGGTGNYDLTIGSGSFIPGFEDALIGMAVGEKRTIDVTFPEEYGSEELAGKPAQFDVTANYIHGEPITPELTDEYVAANTDYATVDEYREYVREYLTDAKLENAEANAQNELWTQVVEGCEFKALPQDKVDEAKESTNSQYEYYAQMYGMEMKDFISAAMGMTEEEYEEMLTTYGEGNVKSMLAFNAIIEKEGLTVSEEEIAAHAQEIADMYGYESAEAVIEEAGEDAVKNDLLWSMVMDLVVSNSKQ